MNKWVDNSKSWLPLVTQNDSNEVGDSWPLQTTAEINLHTAKILQKLDLVINCNKQRYAISSGRSWVPPICWVLVNFFYPSGPIRVHGQYYAGTSSVESGLSNVSTQNEDLLIIPLQIHLDLVKLCFTISDRPILLTNTNIYQNRYRYIGILISVFGIG